MTDPITEHSAIDSNRWEGLRERIISGVILAAIVFAALWLGGWWFDLFIIVIALLMTREWQALSIQNSRGWYIAGLAYIAVPCASLIWLRNLSFVNRPHGGIALVLFVILVVCATDMGAYFTGRRVGGPKLAPSISPGKTWAGLGGGVVGAAIAGAVGAMFAPYPPSAFAGVDIGILLALTAQGGDLFESWLKRRAGVKDSGTLLPGHGGLLDRVDGLVFALPLFALLLYISGVAP